MESAAELGEAVSTYFVRSAGKLHLQAFITAAVHLSVPILLADGVNVVRVTPDT